MAQRPRVLVTSRISALALLVTVPAFSATAWAIEPGAATEPESVASVPEPNGGDGAISDAAVPEPAPTPEGGAEATPQPGPSDGQAVPEPEPEEAVPGPTDGGDAVVPPTVPSSGGAVPSEPSGGVDPSLLDAPEPAETTTPVATQPSSGAAPGLSPEERAEALEDAYAARYRPPDNPVRLNVTGRLVFANISGQDRVNGRMGGASVDVGPSWNHVGVSGTVTGMFGRLLLPPTSGAEMNAMLGGGLTLGLGRLALLSHGYADLRLGYDVFYGAVNQRSDAPTILAPQADDPQFVAEITDNLVPHGPRVRLDIGLVGAGNRRYFHGFGLTMGYQALVGSLKGELPFTNVLSIGFSYWMG